MLTSVFPSGPPPPPRPCKEHLDVGVILDSSNSIKPFDYQKALNFLQSLAQRLQVSEPGSHMAILLYSWEAHTVYRLAARHKSTLPDIEKCQSFTVEKVLRFSIDCRKYSNHVCFEHRVG